MLNMFWGYPANNIITDEDFISLTNRVKNQMQEAIIIKWLILKSIIENLGEWQALYNPDFNYTEFGTIKNAAGSNNFILSLKIGLNKLTPLL